MASARNCTSRRCARRRPWGAWRSRPESDRPPWARCGPGAPRGGGAGGENPRGGWAGGGVVGGGGDLGGGGFIKGGLFPLWVVFKIKKKFFKKNNSSKKNRGPPPPWSTPRALPF